MSRSLVFRIVGLAVLATASVVRPREAVAQGVVGEQRADTAVVRFGVTGMTCGSCATTARLALQRLPGVHGAVVSYDSASALVRYDPRRVNPAVIAQHLERMTGYRATVRADSAASQPSPRPRER